MLKKDLAEALGITPQMVRKLELRGMPMDTVESARQWRSRHLELTRTKRYRADGNTGLPYKPVAPRQVQAPRPVAGEGVAEFELYRAAASFAVQFGLARFGPLMVHIGCSMTDAGSDAMQQAYDRGDDPCAVIDDDAYQAIADEYFALCPPERNGDGG